MKNKEKLIKMKKIYNNKLFRELQKRPVWDVLFTGTPEYPMLRDPRIPTVLGEIDHIEILNNGICFHDRGINGKDNSFIICPKKS